MHTSPIVRINICLFSYIQICKNALKKENSELDEKFKKRFEVLEGNCNNLQTK